MMAEWLLICLLAVLIGVLGATVAAFFKLPPWLALAGTLAVAVILIWCVVELSLELRS